MDNRSLSVDIRREVPGLHPGLNDLIRVLGKQAHCASRTLIVCEPVCPKTSYSESKYHKNCGSPKKGRSWDSLCRPSSLWSPVRPETYYYDCFFYRQYPDRDSEYQEIEEKYNAIKQQKLDYSPPECDEEQRKAIVSGVKVNKVGGAKFTTFGDIMSKSSTGNGARGWKRGEDVHDWYGPGGYKNKDKYGESSMGSARTPNYSPGGSKKNLNQEDDSVPCAELAEIRDLLKRSDRETIRRMQEMLTLMKELSVKDICRATCDRSLPGGRSKVGKRKEDPSDYELQDREMRYQQRGESMTQSRESDGYGQKGLKKGNQQRDEGHESERSLKGYKQRDDEYEQPSRKKDYQQRDSDLGQQRPKKTYRQTDNEDYGPEGPQKNYEQIIDDDYGPQGRRKGYQQRDNDYEPERSSYQHGDDVYGPRKLKNTPYQRNSDASKRKRGNYADDAAADADNYGSVERQESETSYQKGNTLKKNQREAYDGQESIRSSQQMEEMGEEKIVDDEIPAEFEGEYDDEDYVGSQLDLDIQEPRSLQRHLASNSRSRGKVGDDNESHASISSDRSRTSARGGRLSSKGGKMEDRNAASESDTDLTDSSSIYSESSTTDTSGKTKDGESDFDTSDMDDFEALGKESSSRSLKRHQDGSVLGSKASLSDQGSAASLGRTHNKDRSKPGSSKEPKSPKKSRTPGSASVGVLDQPSSGVNYKISVGKKNASLTVHEVVELSNKITDVLVLEVINELIRQGLYSPPSSRYLRKPEATIPRTSAEGSKKSSSSRQRVNEQRASDGTREPSGYQQISRDATMKSIGSPTRLSTIDESSSRTGLSKEPSRKDGSTRNMRPGEQGPSGESKRSSCPRHSKSLSPSLSSRRRSSSCRLEIERRAKSEGDRYKNTSQPADVVPLKPWERRLSSQMKADSMRDSLKGQAKGSSDMPESRRVSMSSQRSKTGVHKPSSTRSGPASLRGSTAGGSYPSRQPTLPETRRNSPGSSPRSTRQYEEQPRDMTGMRGSHGASVSSETSKTATYRSQSIRPALASLKGDVLPESPGSLSRPRIEEPVGPGKIPSDPRFSKEKSRLGIMKDTILPDETLESEPLAVEGQVPLAPRFQPDKTPSIRRIIDPYVSDQPMVMAEKEPSKGRVVRISRSENINNYVPESEVIDAGARTATSDQRSEPCQPDDFIATNYDTDDTTLYYARITENAFPPVKETYHAAGFMLRSAYNYDVQPRSKINVKTDLLMQLPRNCYGRIAPRKCLVENYGIDVGADVIDRDYKGNITVVLFNHGDHTFTVERGNKVAQLICESIHLAKVVENSNLLK